jgi:hypothetical protein
MVPGLAQGSNKGGQRRPRQGPGGEGQARDADEGRRPEICGTRLREAAMGRWVGWRDGDSESEREGEMERGWRG